MWSAYVHNSLSRGKAWLNHSVNGRILAAAGTIASIGLFVKAATVAKEMVVARSFGAGDALDAYYLALLLPGFVSSIVGESFNAAFIPTYIEVREKRGKAAAQRLFSSAGVFNLIVLVVVGLILAASQGWLLPLLGSSFPPRKLAMTKSLLFIFLGLLSISGLNALWRAALNADERFAITAVAPIMNPLLILVTLLAGRHAYGIFALAMGTTIGAFGELAVSGYGLWRLGIPLFPRWYGLDPTLKLVLKQYAPTIAGAMLMGCTTIVDQSMAAMLGSGSVAALNYGNKFLTMVLSVGLSSLSIAVLPSFSKLTAKKDWSGLRHVLFTYTRLIIVVTVPLTALLVFLSRPLIAIFFQGGAFTRQNADLVASVQSLLFLQLPFYSVGILYVRAIASLKRNHILLWGTVISVCVNALLNVIFMKIMGLPGIALSTSAVFLITSTYLGLMLYHALRSEEALQPSYAMAVNSGT